jgi:hypothetical protein
MMTIVEAEGRKTPQTAEERAAAFRSLIAYTAMCQRTAFGGRSLLR